MRITLAVAMTAAGIAGAVQIADAQTKPPVKAERCRALSAEIGRENVWGVHFTGQYKDARDIKYSTNTSPCFRSEQDCTDWLYWAQSTYRDQNNFFPCRLGQPY